jgi:putative transposase
MKVVREKKHRLPKKLYNGYVIVSFTLCIKDRVEIFNDPDIVRKFEELLLMEAEKFNSEVLLYLFMPDHCHILLQGKNEEANVLTTVDRFKQKAGYWLSKNYPEVHWQKDYYDHILRKGKDVRRYIQYVLGNPLRRGIVKDWKEYQFKGSTEYYMDEW